MSPFLFLSVKLARSTPMDDNIITQYQLVKYSDERTFVARVNELLNSGWCLYGPTQVVVINYAIKYCQAMVR